MVFSDGYLYVLILNRHQTEKERMLGAVLNTNFGGASQNPHFYDKHGVQSENTDLYRLLVFDQWGRLVSSNLLTKYVEKITVHQNTLYLVDSFVGMKIYEYAIHLPENEVFRH